MLGCIRQAIKQVSKHMVDFVGVGQQRLDAVHLLVAAGGLDIHKCVQRGFVQTSDKHSQIQAPKAHQTVNNHNWELDVRT